MSDQAVGVIVPFVMQGIAKLFELGVAGAANERVAALPLAVEEPVDPGSLLQANNGTED